MSESGDDRESRDDQGTSNSTELTTDAAISLFTSALNGALEKQKANLIEHFEARLDKTNKATGVDPTDYSFKKEGHKIQHAFNSERLDKLSSIEKCLKFQKLTEATEIISSEKEVLKKRNKILKIADKHGWDTVREYLDSPLADNKEDASDLRAAITW